LVLGLLKVAEQLFYLPRDQRSIEPDDEVLVVATHEDIQRIAHIIYGRRRRLLG
jgi:hypothetical protein